MTAEKIKAIMAHAAMQTDVPIDKSVNLFPSEMLRTTGAVLTAFKAEHAAAFRSLQLLDAGRTVFCFNDEFAAKLTPPTQVVADPKAQTQAGRGSA